MIVVLQNSQSARSTEAKMSAQNRFCLGDRTSWYSIKQYPLQSGCIRNVHYPVKSGIFVQRVEKNRTELDNSDRFLVEVTGFEPATFWSRKMEGHPILSVFINICLIIPDRKATICWLFTESCGIQAKQEAEQDSERG